VTTTIDDLSRMVESYGRSVVNEIAKRQSIDLLGLPPLSPDERALMDERNRIAREEYVEICRLRDLYPSYAWRRRRVEDE